MKIINSFAIFAIVIMLMSSCESKDGKLKSNKAASFSVQEVKNESVKIYKEYAANIEGEQNIEIRPRVDGFIDKIYIHEGSNVKKGQLLFKLNAETLIQQVNAAKANVDVAASQVDLAEVECDKIKPLVEKNIISAIELKIANSKLNAVKSQLNAAKANYLNAKANLSYALITSPVNGIVGSIPYKVGSLVGRNEAKALTTVSNIENVYVYFSMNEKQLLEFIRNLDGDSMDEKISKMPELELYLADGSLYEEKGKIETINGMVNPRTGSVIYRAKFSNKNKLLRNGNSGKLRFPITFNNTIVLAQKSSFEMQGKHFVYTVDKNNIVNSREITISETVGNRIIVTKGVVVGEIVVNDAIMKLRNGMKISPQLSFGSAYNENTLTDK